MLSENNVIRKFCEENRIECEYNISDTECFYMFYKDNEDIHYSPDSYTDEVILAGLTDALEKYETMKRRLTNEL